MTSLSKQGTYRQSVHGGKWLFLSGILQKALSLVSFFILARLLVPEDYGIMAAVFVIMGLFESVTTAGFEKALLQRKEDPAEYLYIAWTFNVCKSFGIALLLWLLAPTLAAIFHIESYLSIIRFGGCFVLIGALSNSRQLYFFRQLDFKKIFLRDAASQLAYMVVALTWAFWISRDVWALVAGHTARYAAGVCMSYVLLPHWPRVSFAFGKLKHLWQYSRWVVGQNILRYALGAVDTVAVGHYMDPARLGIYTKSRDLAFAPLSPVANIIQRVGFLAYSRVQDDTGKIQDGFIKTFDVIAGLGVPIALALIAEGGAIVSILLGEQWLSVVMPLKILAFGILFNAVTSITRPVFDAIGRPDLNVRTHVVELVFSLLFVFVGVRVGLVGVAYAMSAAWFLTMLYSVLLARPILRIGKDKFWPTLVSVGCPIVLMTLLAVPAYYIGIGRQEDTTLSLIWLSTLGVIYVLLVWTFGKRIGGGPRTTLLSIVNELKNT